MPARGSRPIELRVSCIFSLPVEPRRNTAQVARMAPRETPLPVVCDFGDFRRVPEVLIADGLEVAATEGTDCDHGQT